MAKKDALAVIDSKRNELIVSKSGKSAWHSYQYKRENLAELLEDYENQYRIKANKNHINVIENLDTKTITAYLTKAGLAAIANSNKITTKIEVIHRKLQKPYYAEVRGIAILPDGTSHDFIGSCTAEGKRHWFTFNQTLAFAQTKARGGAISIAMEIQAPQWEEIKDSPEMFKRSKLIQDLENETLQKCPWCGVPKAYSKLQKKCTVCGKTVEEAGH